MRSYILCPAITILPISCLFLCLASCTEGSNSNTFLPKGLNSLKVLVKDNLAYPIFQFTCSDAEDPGTNENCPEGFGCDAKHYHGSAIAIGTVQTNGASDVTFLLSAASQDDPDRCHCGWGKVMEADVRTLTVFQVDVEVFASRLGLTAPQGNNPTIAEQLNVDPCGT